MMFGFMILPIAASTLWMYDSTIDLAKINGPEDLQPIHFSTEWYFTPGTPENWKTTIPAQAKPFVFYGKTNLDSVAGKTGKEMDECVLHTKISIPEAGIAEFGVSADWWVEIYVNGKLALSTMEKGNLGWKYEPEEHPVFVRLPKGESLLSIYVRRGMHSWTFACGNIAFRRPDLPTLDVGPWLMNPDSGAMTVRFTTLGKIGAGVRYRKAGTEEWKTVWDAQNCVIQREYFHSIRLTGLEPGAEYEYQVLLISPENDYKAYAQDTRRFRTVSADAEEYSFMVVADLQDVNKQLTHLKTLCRACDAAHCDFVVFNGDIGSLFDDMNADLLKGAISMFIRETGAGKPLIYVRGNHEMRGREAQYFPKFFGFENSRTYGIFRIGKTAFLALDSWEDKTSDRNAIGKYNLDEFFYAQQAEFLKTALETEAWKTAERHIMICHAAPYSHFDPCMTIPFVLQEMTDPYFEGTNPKHKLDAWFAGHTHVYSRSIPGTDVIAEVKKHKPPFKGGKTYTYPVLTGGGWGGSPEVSAFRVNVSRDKIEVKAFDQDGRLFDHVILKNDGSYEELVPIQHTEYKEPSIREI